MVNDQWTKMASYSAMQGSSKEITPENLSEHISELHALDFPRQERLRKRTEVRQSTKLKRRSGTNATEMQETVKDQKTAKQLQAWYPGWCKSKYWRRSKDGGSTNTIQDQPSIMSICSRITGRACISFTPTVDLLTESCPMA